VILTTDIKEYGNTDTQVKDFAQAKKSLKIAVECSKDLLSSSG
jgi:hypothetical protein